MIQESRFWECPNSHEFKVLKELGKFLGILKFVISIIFLGKSQILEFVFPCNCFFAQLLEPFEGEGVLDFLYEYGFEENKGLKDGLNGHDYRV